MAREEELGMWEEWRKTQDPEVLSALLTSMDPLIQKRVMQFRAAPLPQSAVEAEARKQAIKAFETFKPAKGAQLGTHVNNYLQKVYRYVSTYQNIGRMPESRTAKIDLYHKTKSYLEQVKGREPSTVEMADELGWSKREVGRMERELRKDLGLEQSFGEMSFNEFDRNADLLNYGYYELTPEEQNVFDYTVGMHGKPRLKMADIARRTGKTVRQVGLIKNRIVKKLKRFQ
jgi:DNA-directed RNA polymerase sigma subunit (sigma70/sigma32)